MVMFFHKAFKRIPPRTFFDAGQFVFMGIKAVRYLWESRVFKDIVGTMFQARRNEISMVDEYNETDVPGLYIALALELVNSDTTTSLDNHDHQQVIWSSS